MRTITSGKNKNISYYLFLLFFYLFLFKDLFVDNIKIIDYLDEAIALLAFPLFILEIKYRDMRLRKQDADFILLITIFVLSGLAGNILCKYQPFWNIALPSMYLSIKFWLTIYVGERLFKQLRIQQISHKLYFHVRLIILIYACLILLDNIVGIYSAVISFGLRSTHLFYNNPTSFVAMCVFLYAILRIIKPYVDGSIKYEIILLVFMGSTLKSKAFAAIMAFVLIYYFIYLRKRKKITLKTFVLFIPPILLLAWNKIEFYFFSDIQLDSARYQLLNTSFKILKDYFPFGTGFGTFGSHFSAVFYSPVYDMYQISGVNGLRPGATKFVSDSFWAMIIGETGFIGTIVLVSMIIILFKRIQTIRFQGPSLYTSALSMFVYLLISSSAESAFVNPILMPLALCLGLIFANIPSFEGALLYERKKQAIKKHGTDCNR